MQQKCKSCGDILPASEMKEVKISIYESEFICKYCIKQKERQQEELCSLGYVNFIEEELKKIQEALLGYIRKIGSTEAASRSGKTKAYFTDLIHNRAGMTYNQTLELAKIIFLN